MRLRSVLPFADRVDAGRRLARQLQHLAAPDVVVLGLPRGGVPVAFEVARALGAPLDVIVVRKLGFPLRPELAMGAIGEGGCEVIDRAEVALQGVTDEEVRAVERRERDELEARVRRLRGDRDRIDLTGRTALIVDDGIATGATAEVACRVARLQGAARVVVAAPVAPRSAADVLDAADALVVVESPEPFRAVGCWYSRFEAVTDEEVAALLGA
ncbi:phosphoribosyltransferase [Aeromicrobium choanae]|uniref:Predicted phosphoribosyltransferase n=1 Tax=Aeromicrobium choanae TaxID=1736691 RepID=A0A1T4Z7X1_9ACTN|nr:phosphoribosyltransferase family protein [Aeromicrobium choanae]SKB10167.1 Predicted phosphoribosyltransferase [Aeromicrobium choanae]